MQLFRTISYTEFTSGAGITTHATQRARKSPFAMLMEWYAINILHLGKMSSAAFNDDGRASRSDGGSQSGYVITACHIDLTTGKEATVSLVDWKSWRLKRVGSSSLSAECKSMAETLDIHECHPLHCWQLSLGISPARKMMYQDEELTKCTPGSARYIV